MSTPISQNPRRRSSRAPSPLGQQLRKSGTFSSPKTLSTDICDLDNQLFMPRRSPTSTEELEALVQDQLPFRIPSLNRVTNFLKDFDQKIAGQQAASTLGDSILTDPEVLPLPSFFLKNSTLDSTPMDIDPKPTVAEKQSPNLDSDSGLGSSISGSKYDDTRTQHSSVRESISSSVSSTHSAITRSFSSTGSTEEKHLLGEYACRQIHEALIEPILREKELKDFHPLINDVPRRIGEKNICNLRDLEKTLIFLAPNFSATPQLYERFAVRAITLLHLTVNRLPEQDQRLPTDRPYTNNYFLDLIEQIRRYAAIMAATRQKEANGENLDKMDYSRDEKITLRGGLSHNGSPMELVREKNGEFLPLGEGSARAKRAFSDEETDEDEITRSMARRRRSEKPGDVVYMCRDCNKQYKRPCDLTKHEKTHSRPWKCTEKRCKYFEYGWPTEKERDRHINDKHSAAPAQYKCLYPPCTYMSKRESNCKQHMEKAHGWTYVRSKSNGSKKALARNDLSPPTPLTPFVDTPQSTHFATPITPFAPSPQVPLIGATGFYGGYGTPALSAHDPQNDLRRNSTTTDGSPFIFSSGYPSAEQTSFFDAATPEDPAFNHDVIFGDNSGYSTNFGTAFQQPTPALSTGFDFDHPPFISDTNLNSGMQHMSSTAQPDVTLFNSQMPFHGDEGFDDSMDMDSMDMQLFNPPGQDFQLFAGDQSSNSLFGNCTSNFFPDVNSFGVQFPDQFPPTLDLMGNTDDLMSNTFGNMQ